jgi:hypothetical protein
MLVRKSIATFCQDIADYLDEGATMDVIFDFPKKELYLHTPSMLLWHAEREF